MKNHPLHRKLNLVFVLLSIILMATLLLSCGKKETVVETNPTIQTEETTTAQPENPITSFINHKGSGASDTVIKEDLDTIAKVYPEQADDWAYISEYWDMANEDGFVNLNTLPDGLPADDSLCIVALGYQLNKDGTPKQELIERLKIVLACAEQYPNAYVAVTGGGTAADDPDATEADIMAEWLIENGLEKSRIIIENQSRTTAENAILTYRILKKDYPHVKNIALVSSDYHIAVACAIFETADRIGEEADHCFNVIGNAACETKTKTMDMATQARFFSMLQPYCW